MQASYRSVGTWVLHNVESEQEESPAEAVDPIDVTPPNNDGEDVAVADPDVPATGEGEIVSTPAPAPVSDEATAAADPIEDDADGSIVSDDTALVSTGGSGGGGSMSLFLLLALAVSSVLASSSRGRNSDLV